MHPIKLLGIVRRVEREAARRGYQADSLIDDPMLPDTGTLVQQLDMAAIGIDARLGPLSTRDRQIVSRLIRNCVLSSPLRRPGKLTTNNVALARAWKQGRTQ